MFLSHKRKQRIEKLVTRLKIIENKIVEYNDSTFASLDMEFNLEREQTKLKALIFQEIYGKNVHKIYK